MKYIRYSLMIFGFICQSVMPISLFGLVIPYWHGELEAGFTATGLFALAVLSIIVISKLKNKLNSMEKGTLRGVILHLAIPLSIWLIAGKGIDFVERFVINLINYWWIAGIFLAIGGVMYLIEEILSSMEKK